MFIDRVKIRVQGGHGGNGVTAFRREKFVPRGGPSGGDGGRGGDVWIVADSSLNTLFHLRYNPEHMAGRGIHGEGSKRSGRDGQDVIVRVPVGTQIFEVEVGEFLQDLAIDGASGWLRAAAVEDLATHILQPRQTALLDIIRRAVKAKNLSCNSN